VIMLTGDNENTAKAVADEFNVLHRVVCQRIN
jgi:magnesium-transporting ATPase (P-type)